MKSQIKYHHTNDDETDKDHNNNNRNIIQRNKKIFVQKKGKDNFINSNMLWNITL